MHDIRYIRENPAGFDDGLRRRGLGAQAQQILELDQSWRSATARHQELLSARNDSSKKIGQAKAKKDEAEAQRLMAEVARLKDEIPAMELRVRESEEALNEILGTLPNLPAADVPEGADETANQEMRRWGAPRQINFAARQHFDIGETLGLMDFEAAAKMSGARFVILRGKLARLERALANFMLDLHTGTFGYEEVVPPFLVRDQAMYGTAQLPKFREEQFGTTNGFWLIPTSEVPLTNQVREMILDESQLPMRFTAWTPCFRSEAGAAGRDTRGMIRMHQFSKVELVSITTPEQSAAEHERMTACAEEVLKRLELAHRTMVLSTGDMGFAAQRTHDIEVWLPGQNAFREISSCSNCGDFQARRMNARYKPADGKSNRFVHTLNGSGLAVGRTLIAVLENYQQADGSISIPAVLRPYMGGEETITPHG
ncbi:MAG: serine--tRNA ligase [Alphaproteobacteria bacterium]